MAREIRTCDCECHGSVRDIR